MDAKGRGGLKCCSPWGHERRLDTTWQLYNSNNKGRRERKKEGGEERKESTIFLSSSHSTKASNKISFALSHYVYMVPVHRPGHTLSAHSRENILELAQSIESTYYPPNWKGGV